MDWASIPYAELTEKGLQKLVEAEKFINNQPDQKMKEGGEEEVILLAYSWKKNG